MTDCAKLRDLIAAVDDFTAGSLQAVIDLYCGAQGLSIGQVGPPLRAALTGGLPAPELAPVMEWLGRDEVLRDLTSSSQRPIRPDANRKKDERGLTMQSKMKEAGTATIEVNGKSIELPVLEGTDGPNVIDVRKLYSEAGVFTLDPGFTSTGSCESQITFIDGDEGRLLHRGYPIDQLAENSGFLEVAYLLLKGELPTQHSSLISNSRSPGTRCCMSR